jgi:tetratricopeptide (TPR) repeat protein
MMTMFKNSLILIAAVLYCSPVLSENFTIVSYSGEVDISQDQKIWNSVVSDQTLESGTWLKTNSNSSVTILLPDRTQTKVSQNAEFQLNYSPKEKQTNIDLKLGKIWSKTNKKPIKIKVKAPNAVATIRGTEWVIDVSEDSSSKLAVLEGEIDVSGGKNTQQSISSGDVADISRDGGISVSKIINPAGYIQFIFNYKIEPLAYFPFIEQQQRYEASKNLQKTILSGALQTKCKFYDSETRDKFLDLIAKSSIECLLAIQPNLMTGKALKDWANLILAEANLSQGNINEGLSIVSSLKGSSGKSYVKAKYHFSIGEYDEALDLLTPAKMIAPNGMFFEAMIGDIENAKGNFLASEEFYSNALTLAPDWHKPLIRMAEIKIALGEFDAAINFIKQAKNINPSSYELDGVEAQYFSYRYQLKEARRIAKSVIEDNPTQLEMLVAFGIIELKEGNGEKALEYFTKATLIERNYAKAYVFMAVAHLHLDEIAQALIQLERAVKLDPQNPLPHVVASQIYSSNLDAERALEHAKSALIKSDGNANYSQLANDQQGGANVGRRFAEVGLPLMARESSQQIRDNFWAGSYLFAASTANNDLERNSNYMRGFVLDSQTFGTRRDAPDVIAKPGEYGYIEYRLGLGEENGDVGLKFGKNGKKINGDIETSFLYDIGFFGTERDAYLSSDDTDESKFALGFLGLGKRENYDTNTFLTANFIPFESDGTYPVEDNTLRVDAGHSVRKDSQITLNTTGAEIGSANINLFVEGGCSGTDNMKTQGFEFGHGRLLQNSKDKTENIFIESAIKKATSSYEVTGTACSDLSSLTGGTYSIRDENIDSLEYEVFGSYKSLFKKGEVNYEVKLNSGFYHHRFDQSIFADGASVRDFTSKKNDLYLETSLGMSQKLSTGLIRVAGIFDRHPLRQAPISIDSIAGISSHYEFVNTGGKIKQLSLQYVNEVNKNKSVSFMGEGFNVKNNPLYLLFREQWNADLLQNFTLNKYFNVNSASLFDTNNEFSMAEFRRLAVAYEEILSPKYTIKLGAEIWQANEKDHPKYLETEELGKVKGVPDNIAYAGITRFFDDSSLSFRAVRNENVRNDSQIIDQDIIQSSFLTPFINGELTIDLTAHLNENSYQKIILLYRNYF